MENLQNAIGLAFEAAESIQDPRMGAVKLSLQQAAANAGLTDFALHLRGRLVSGVREVGASGRRFSTVPPANLAPPPNVSAAPPIAERAASEPEEAEQNQQENADAAASVFSKIANMSPSAIVNQYGESAIERMITANGGSLAEVEGKKPNQKAAYLKSLVTPEAK